MAALREEAATLRASEAALQAKVKEVEAAMQAKMQKLEAATQTKVTELEATIGDLQRQKNNIDAILMTEQMTLRRLGEEKRRLEQSVKASEAAARAALEAAQGEADMLRAANADCGRKVSIRPELSPASAVSQETW